MHKACNLLWLGDGGFGGLWTIVTRGCEVVKRLASYILFFTCNILPRISYSAANEYLKPLA